MFTYNPILTLIILVIFGCEFERGAKKQYPKKAVHVKVAMKKAVPELAVVKKQHL